MIVLPVLGTLAASAFLVMVIDIPRIALLAGFVALGIGALANVLYHRRKLAELRELHVPFKGQWRKLHAHMPWPKVCRYCSAHVWDWRAAGVHTDPELSACAALASAREKAAELPPEPAPQWTAAVIERAGMDTLTDDNEADQVER